MSTTDEAEALDLARKALVICEHDVYIPVRLTRDALTAIKQARSADVQEPVARIEINYRHGELESWRFAEKPVNAPAGIYDVYAIAAPDITYSIDADPSGIRKRAADAIIGALTLGAQDSPPPPEGHWLQQFWNIGRAEASKATPPTAQRQWVGLTVNERGKVYADWRWSDGRTSNLALCEAIEAKLKEKNRG
jgi:hypothetical protein